MQNTTCHYVEANLPESWERMAYLASQGLCSWTKVQSFPDNREVSVLCCLSPACARKSQQCELADNAVVFMARTTRRRGVGLAIQVFPEPKDVIYLRASDHKIIWADPYVGRWFSGNATPPGKEIDHVVGTDDYSGIEIKLRCYALCDISSEQTTMNELRASNDWDLDTREDTMRIEVTGVPR